MLSVGEIILIDATDEQSLTISNDLNNHIDTKNIRRRNSIPRPYSSIVLKTSPQNTSELTFFIELDGIGGQKLGQRS